ncbi:RNA polymerase sigma factor [Pseudomaricurvus alkylphenolicus]|uniref:RNA polymerase sigma factor n=1 Tax=Pseudomaricurvus alkylphenolicus TaxID=1306991 RepID=UPI0019816520|nr:RNA polymerase sigma factor [Pseudomaricurvus alkylphenolicus]
MNTYVARGNASARGRILSLRKPDSLLRHGVDYGATMTTIKSLDKTKETSGKGNTSQSTALSESFLNNTGMLKQFLTRFLKRHQDIEDVVQETYLRAHLAEQKSEIQQPKAFLFRVAKNIALNELKKKSRQITDFIEDCDPQVVIENTDTLESELEAQQHLGLYCEAIAQLPEKCRQACLLRKVHGMSHKEIAERMDLTVSSVEKYLAKGVLACQAYIQKRETGQAGNGAKYGKVNDKAQVSRHRR